MDSQAGDSGGLRSRKRPASRTSVSTSSVTQETATALSHKSRSTAAHYRFTVLSKARIYIHPTLTPDKIRTQIDTVIQRELNPEKKEQLSIIAQRLSDVFAEMLSEAAGEDDWIEPFCNVLSNMDHSKSVSFQRKAVEPQYEVEEVVDRPSKRQRGGKSNLTPGSSESAPKYTMNDKTTGVKPMPPPPPLLPRRIGFSVKTPRPDIMIGLRNVAVVNALLSQEVTEVQTKRFLKNLQDTKDPNRGEPILYSAPTKRPLDIRFPFLLVEGKSYATSNPIFDAQNQTAVSGACPLKVLHDLDDLANKPSREAVQRTVRWFSVSALRVPTMNSGRITRRWRIVPVAIIWFY
ncbi:hypothetical protein B0J14DRAFT_636334 [Halenospora varia]|nr:hypothetical protein B0J14DRAFT_636334 [Halenospora varia]